jgi:hypothetical protein
MTQENLKLEILSRGGSLHTKEKRDVTIRVRKWTKEKLKTMGSSGNDNDDVIFQLIEFWEKHHRQYDERSSSSSSS